MILFLSLTFPYSAGAHAVLEKAVPGPDSRMDAAPSQVHLSFNESLETQLFYIRVLDTNGRKVTSAKAVMSTDRREISLPLPALKEGYYTVSYHVISQDGHPIDSSYIFCVGNPATQSPQSEAPPTDGGHSLQGHPSLAQLLGFAFRIVYYLSLLTLTGWVLSKLVYPLEPDEARRINDLWRLNLLRIFLLSLIAMIGFQLPNYILEWNLDELSQLIFGTMVGISWLISLVLAFAAFAFLGRSKGFSWIWLSGVMISESINGHAIAAGHSIFNTVILDIVHLLAASFWVGGLFYLLIHWNKNRDHARSFLPVFSNMAFYSILFLIVSGVLWTVVMVPHLKYLLYTVWGNLLIAKTALVILVIAAGSAIRRLMKRNKGNAVQTAVKVDFGIMLAIVGIVGVFTYLNPLPQNTPLHWHVMGEKIHMTARITPNSPGTNKFTVRVWLPEQQAKPKYVQMYLNYKDDPELAPIEVPLEASKGLEPDLFPGFKQCSYEKEGPYLPFAGRWELEIRVMDSNDEETVYRKEESVY